MYTSLLGSQQDKRIEPEKNLSVEFGEVAKLEMGYLSFLPAT